MVPFINYKSLYRFIFIIFILHGSHIYPASQKPQLLFYTYQSFLSKWGPGVELAAKFEKDCNCQIKWRSFPDPNSLLGQAKFEGRSLKADLVLGIDQLHFQSMQNQAVHYQSPSSLKQAEFEFPIFSKLFEKGFLPFDYGYFSFVVNKNLTVKNDHLMSFIESLPDRSLIIQDPRLSSMGRAFTLWLYEHSSKKDEKVFVENLKTLQRKILTITQSWSDAYSLFLKGEGKAVLSYTLSEAYHKKEDPLSPYKSIIFSHGQPIHIEGAFIGSNSNNKRLVKSFLNFIWSKEGQLTIARKNFMYPAVKKIFPFLPKEFQAIKKPPMLNISQFETSEWRKILNTWNNSLANF